MRYFESEQASVAAALSSSTPTSAATSVPHDVGVWFSLKWGSGIPEMGVWDSGQTPTIWGSGSCSRPPRYGGLGFPGAGFPWGPMTTRSARQPVGHVDLRRDQQLADWDDSSRPPRNMGFLGFRGRAGPPWGPDDDSPVAQATPASPSSRPPRCGGLGFRGSGSPWGG